MGVANSYDRYRMDYRTKEQFAEDILKGSQVERDIIEKYVSYYQTKYGKTLTVTDNGCDNSGQLLGRKQVNTKADFLLNGKPVEVKFNKQKLAMFHFKAEQLESYLKQQAAILWVNGYETDQPVFTVLKEADMLNIKQTRKPVHFIPWGGKLYYELLERELCWTKFFEEVNKVGKVINYLDYKTKLEAELNDFLAALYEQAQANGRTMEEEFTDLDPMGIFYYEHLLLVTDKLKQWEAVEQQKVEVLTA